jgi:hypothetical protein
MSLPEILENVALECSFCVQSDDEFVGRMSEAVAMVLVKRKDIAAIEQCLAYAREKPLKLLSFSTIAVAIGAYGDADMAEWLVEHDGGFWTMLEAADDRHNAEILEWCRHAEKTKGDRACGDEFVDVVVDVWELAKKYGLDSHLLW